MGGLINIITNDPDDVAAAFAWALFSETLGVIGYLGAASVIAGVLLVATAGSAGTGLSAPRAH